jgi:hypothetical protein
VVLPLNPPDNQIGLIGPGRAHGSSLRSCTRPSQQTERKVKTLNTRLTTIVAVAAIGGGELAAKEKHKKPEPAQPQDQIAIEAHIALGDGPVMHFIATRHYDRSYVYAERAPGKPVTLIDVTNPGHPQVLSNTSLPPSSGSLLEVAGTAALATNVPVGNTVPAQIVHLMDFSDPVNPKVMREFDGVTAVEKIGGIILLANGEGIWILSQHLAEDPAAQQRYARKIVYGESMY